MSVNYNSTKINQARNLIKEAAESEKYSSDPFFYKVTMSRFINGIINYDDIVKGNFH